MRRFNREREAQIARYTENALDRAVDFKEPITAVVCAGAPWCFAQAPGCEWCTHIEAHPDGRVIRTEPHYA